jgi:hypothetical protein
MELCGNLACWSCLMNHPKIHDRFSMLGLGKFVLGGHKGVCISGTGYELINLFYAWKFS